MIVLALAGPWLALAFLLIMQELELWLDDSLWGDPARPGGSVGQGEDLRSTVGHQDGVLELG